MVDKLPRLAGRPVKDSPVLVRTKDVAGARRVTLQQPGGEIVDQPFQVKDGVLSFVVPGRMVCALAEISFK